MYDRQSCSFMMMVRAMTRTLRELVEVISVCIHFEYEDRLATFNGVSSNRASTIPLSEFARLPALLPFGKPPSAIGALVLRQVLLAADDYSVGCTNPASRIDYLVKLFPSIPNLEHHLFRLFSFVTQALRMLSTLPSVDSEIVSQQLVPLLPGAIRLVHAKFALHFPGHQS